MDVEIADSHNCISQRLLRYIYPEVIKFSKPAWRISRFSDVTTGWLFINTAAKRAIIQVIRKIHGNILMSCDVDVIIIGAGVIGLAVASEVAHPDRQVYILEKNESFGRETSSRNSGTIHTGILSPSGSLNAELCLEGNTLLHEICRRYQVDHRFIDKLLVACTDTEEADLETLFQRCSEGITMQKLSRRELFQIEPEIHGRSALRLPEAGVVEPYSLMRCYLSIAEDRDACLICRTKVIGIQKLTEGYGLDMQFFRHFSNHLEGSN